MKKIFLGSVFFIILVLCSIQIYYINSHSINVPICIYNKNEEVSFNYNFFNSSQESSVGYTITVLGTDQFDIETFKKIYNIKDELEIEFAEYVSLVHVKIKNFNNTSGDKAGIDMQRFILQNGSYITYFSQIVYPYINTHPETKFSLAENDELEFWIPFMLTNNNINIHDFNSGDSYLIVSLYPTKCMIKL